MATTRDVELKAVEIFFTQAVYITQLEAKIDRYGNALEHIANHGGGEPETLVSVMGHTAKVALREKGDLK